jgi:hypothetical protein
MQTTTVKAWVMLDNGGVFEYTAEVVLSRYNPRSVIRRNMIARIEAQQHAKVIDFQWVS